MRKSIATEGAELGVVLRAKANNGRFTKEERDWLRYAGSTIGKLSQDHKIMETAIRSTFEWAKTDSKSTESRQKAMANLQGICARALEEVYNS